MESTNAATIAMVQHHLNPLAARFWHPEWVPKTGVNFSTPEMTAQKQAAHGEAIDPAWEVSVEKVTRDSRHLSDTSMRYSAPAVLRFESADALLATPVEEIGYRLARYMAARAAHEALEWIRLDEQLVIDPHGSQEAIDDALEGIIEYFEIAAQE